MRRHEDGWCDDLFAASASAVAVAVAAVVVTRLDVHAVLWTMTMPILTSMLTTNIAEKIIVMMPWLLLPPSIIVL